MKDKIRFIRGFTLIELIIVIAIIGILAASLITVIDPFDKIASANDSAVISTITQIGKSLETYATTHNTSYPGGASYTLNNALSDLSNQGESKFSSVTAPNGYTYNYKSAVDATGTACTTAAQSCHFVQVWVNLTSKKNISASKNFYWFINGKSCFQAAAPVQTNPWSSCP